MKLIIIIPVIIIISAITKIDFKIQYIGFLLLNMLFVSSRENGKIYILILIDILIIVQTILFNNMMDMNESILFCNFILIVVYSTSVEGQNLLKKILYEERKIFLYSTIIISIIFICSFFSSSGWLYVWEGKQFIGVISFPHDACYFFAGIQSCYIVLYDIFNNKIIKKVCFWGNALFVVFSLLTNARAPFIISAFMFIFFIYRLVKKKYIIIYFLVTIPISIILIAILFNLINYDLIFNIPILNKFFVTIERGNITNSRDIIWESILINYNENFGFIDRLIGKGTYFSKSINLGVMGSPLWAHNDFLEVLVCMGYYGISIYIYSIYTIFKSTKNVIFITILITVAFFNGIFVYRQIVFFIPIIILVLNYNKILLKDI